MLDHIPSLVELFWEGDLEAGELPGMILSAEERSASARDRARMFRQSRSDSNAQGGKLRGYSIKKQKDVGLRK